MKLSILFSAALGALVSADNAVTPTGIRPGLTPTWLPCAVPFPIGDLYNPESNATIASLAATYYNNQSISHDSDHGASDGLQWLPGKPQPWPRDDATRLVYIHYCWVQEWQRNSGAKAVFDKATIKWQEQMGGYPTRATGYAVVFRERKDENRNPMFCYKQGHDKKWGFGWNDDIPLETVAIDHWPQRGIVSGTLGVMRTNPPSPWQNTLHLDDLTIGIAMHEMAHVMGMATTSFPADEVGIPGVTSLTHEHQRWDRDTYVRVLIDQLKDYPRAFAAAKKDNAQLTKEQFIADPFLMSKHNFIGAQYVKGWTGQYDWPLDSRGPYDDDSITHYTTAGDNKPECKPDNPEACALLGWVDPHKHDAYHAISRDPEKVSEGDKAWLRGTYPWMDRPSP